MTRRSELFPPMWKVVPEGTHGNVSVEHFTVSETESRMTALQGGRGYVPPGKYAALRRSDGWRRETIMSDTPYERNTNTEIVRRATGRVLIAGYGLGMILTAILKKPDVQQVVVVEKSAECSPSTPASGARVTALAHRWSTTLPSWARPRHWPASLS